jgi:CRISPR-associated protein Cas5d
MNEERGPTLRVRARGPMAIFTRPELKVERVSYLVPTPSAMRGLLEAILWRPAISWNIERILVLNEIKFISFKRNEVNAKLIGPSKNIIKKGGSISPLTADDDDTRAQRNTVALRDVDYQVEAHFMMTEKAGKEDNITKFVKMFERYIDKGIFFYQPYFGCRECPAEILPPLADPQPIFDSRDLGLMLWDIRYGKTKKEQNVPLLFHAKLENGVLKVPPEPLGSLEVAL